MSTVKISELPVISQINANTANTIFIGLDIPTNITGKMTLTTLAQGLYSNNNLYVGNTFTVLPNAIAQYTGTSDLYIQSSLQNLSPNGSGDLVVTADNGTDETYFIDVGIAGSDYVFEGDSLNKPDDGYLIVVGADPSEPGGNLSIGTLTEGKDINIFQGGLSEANVTMKFSYTNGIKLMQKPLTFADGTSQNSAVNYANVNSRITANVVALNSSITSNITTANAFTQAAFNKANNALANTSGIFGGNLTITGNTSAQAVNTANLVVVGTANVSGTLNVVGAVSMNATLLLSNSNFSATEAAVTISASGTVVTPANDGYMIHISGKNGVASRVVTDSYGTGAYALYAGRAARGTVDSPTALQAGDVIARYSGSGYGTTKYQTLGVGRIDFIAAENFTDANTGSQIKFWNCPIGSNTLTNIATFNGLTAVFSGTIVPEKGVMYTPRLPAGAQTAITVDFSADSIIKANFSAPVTISFSNYTAGKVVEMWLTNTAGNGQTVTHGCLANNSTKGVTSFSVAAGQSAHMKYFSIDGDQANTFVAITYN